MRICGYGYADTDTRIRIRGHGYADTDTRIRVVHVHRTTKHVKSMKLGEQARTLNTPRSRSALEVLEYG